MSEGYRRVPLSELADLRMGGTPSRTEPRYWAEGQSGHPWVSIADLAAKFIDTTRETITDSGVRAARLRPVPPGVPIMSFKLSIGKCAISKRQVFTNEAIIALFAREGRSVAQWLYHVVPGVARRQISTTAVKGQTLNLPKLRNLLVPTPTAGEQQRIAEILDILDEQIRHCQRTVSRSHIIRVAMLAELLTRDIFRTQPMEALLTHGPDAMRSGPFGSELLTSELRSSGIPLLGIDNVEEDRFVPYCSRFVDLAKFRELQRYKVKPRDIMVTIMGTVGRCCVVPENIELALSSKHVWAITLDQDKYRPWLASLQINYAPWVRQHFNRHSQGGIMSAIRSETLRTLSLPTPPLETQRMIEDILRAQTELIARERETLDKLRLLKNGLMEDLLTGKVRVTRSGELTG